jgi:hypothetical protein
MTEASTTSTNLAVTTRSNNKQQVTKISNRRRCKFVTTQSILSFPLWVHNIVLGSRRLKASLILLSQPRTPAMPMMSRGASYTSQYSSTSSGQHYTESPHFASHHSLPNIWSPNGIGMQRSASLHSNASFLYSQQQSPQLDASPLHQLHDDFLTNSSSAIFSPATQYRPSTVYLDESAISCSPSHPTDAFNLVFGNLGHSNR